MDLTLALRVIAGWQPFNQLPQHHQARLAELLQPLRLRPGQKLYDYDSLPPGVCFVVSGLLRLLARDDAGEPFTVQRFGPAAMVGERALLRGVSGFALQAATPTELWLMPAGDFLEAVEALPKSCPLLVEPTLEELYGVVAISRRPNLPARPALRDWASSLIATNGSRQQVLLLAPGSHSLPQDGQHWLVSSSNLEGGIPAMNFSQELICSFGAAYQGGFWRFLVDGLLPTRAQPL